MSSTFDYERVVKELCLHLGAASQWPEVVRTQHVLLDETPVGLIHDDARTDDTLCIFVDLGERWDGANECLRLLTANATLGPADRGYFAVHPDHGRVVYCANVRLSPELSGQALGERIAAMLDDAREVMSPPHSS